MLAPTCDKNRLMIRVQPDDPAVALYRNLRDAVLRRSIEAEHGVFIAEGRFIVERLIHSTVTVRSLLLLDGRADELAAVADAKGIEVMRGDRATLEAIAGFDVHRGVLALAERPAPPPLAVLTGARRILAAEGLTDAENVGALVRTASALGFDALVVDPTAADPFSRRAVRVSMGEALMLPILTDPGWPSVLETIGGVVVALTLADGAIELDAVGSADRMTVLVGAEGTGLSARALAAATVHARIPMHRGADSLNVAAAAAIAMYALRD
jgi:tRNA G18 (ribose-2'-O)-methylase SpoU